MIQFIPAIISALPAIAKLFDKDERGEGVRELTGTVLNEASKSLGVDFRSKDTLISHLNSNPDAVIKMKEIDTAYEIRIAELKIQDRANTLLDKQSARVNSLEMYKSDAPFLVKITSSIIAIATVLSAAALDTYILYEGFAKGLEALNPVITLIAGNVSARAAQVLGYYYGAADTKEHINRG